MKSAWVGGPSSGFDDTAGVDDAAAESIARAATLRRSVELFQSFRVEQTDPATFYSALAQDSVQQVLAFTDLHGAHVLDVGGGPGYFADAFAEHGALYTPLDADAGELRLHGRTPEPGTVMGDGEALPFRAGSFDVTYSSNVAEHVRRPWAMADELVRVTKPGGFVFYSYTLWYGPWGGHETAPWHFLGGSYAARRYRKRTGRPPKNEYGKSLFPITAGAGLRWARTCSDATLIAAYPRYLPAWSWAVTRVPVLRELLTWNLMLVLRKR